MSTRTWLIKAIACALKKMLESKVEGECYSFKARANGWLAITQLMLRQLYTTWDKRTTKGECPKSELLEEGEKSLSVNTLRPSHGRDTHL
ncbi:hypothetical protein [Dyadobacter chenhuakuii]|uniref:Uncharacterized protein n=1 Tax=Dyadobacter chenhuakuii TaxID=2909339 RepID=A0ABY4XIE4_9BACT|nr:hypothetical protein [Dyadobacter chenhuakuii]MCF2496122.1 hypothetical protein [Dyadobacter chenhuakuii]USJ30186.1 hypothetical protein NFI80_20265 [Dyadobacter chenhuakuii]